MVMKSIHGLNIMQKAGICVAMSVEILAWCTWSLSHHPSVELTNLVPSCTLNWFILLFFFCSVFLDLLVVRMGVQFLASYYLLNNCKSNYQLTCTSHISSFKRSAIEVTFMDHWWLLCVLMVMQIASLFLVISEGIKQNARWSFDFLICYTFTTAKTMLIITKVIELNDRKAGRACLGCVEHVGEVRWLDNMIQRSSLRWMCGDVGRAPNFGQSFVLSLSRVTCNVSNDKWQKTGLTCAISSVFQITKIQYDSFFTCYSSYRWFHKCEQHTMT
jgi:hypothetical protein